MAHAGLSRWFCVAYDAALRLYPRAFRERFGHEMAQVFRQQVRYTAETAGYAGLLALGLRSTGDWMLSSIQEGVASMSTGSSIHGAAAQPAGDVPVFYLCDESLPRTSALLNGAVLAAAFLTGVCLLIGHGGGFPSVLIGTSTPNHSHMLSAPTAAAPAPLDTEVRIKPEPAAPPIPLYFRVLEVVAALDANHDGVISSLEIKNAPAALAKLDANHDGKLDAAECGMHLGEEEQTPGPSVEELTATLMAFDRNHDGKLEREEVPERLRGLFDRGDPRNTGVLTAEEIRKLAEEDYSARSPRRLDPQFVARARLAFMRIHPVLAALDTDRNGEISASEMRNASPMLRRLDDNGDGSLSVDEILPDPVAASVAQFVAIFDTNNDGLIAPSEWTPAFSKNLRAVLHRAGRGPESLVSEQELTNQIRLFPVLKAVKVNVYGDLQDASRKGFAAMLTRRDPAAPSVAK